MTEHRRLDKREQESETKPSEKDKIQKKRQMQTSQGQEIQTGHNTDTDTGAGPDGGELETVLSSKVLTTMVQVCGCPGRKTHSDFFLRKMFSLHNVKRHIFHHFYKTVSKTLRIFEAKSPSAVGMNSNVF